MDVADACLKLYQIELDRWNKRREYEWKVTLTFWSGAVAVAAFLAGKMRLTPVHLLPYSAVWLVYVFLWLRGVWRANVKDKARADHYRGSAEAVLRGETMPEYVEPTPGNFLCDWSVQSQAIITGILLLLSWYVLWVAPLAPARP